jgi:hypothetical protein
MDILYWTSVGAIAGAAATAIIGGVILHDRISRKIRRLEARMDVERILANDRSRADFKRMMELDHANRHLHHELHTIKQHRLESWKEASQ